MIVRNFSASLQLFWMVVKSKLFYFFVIYALPNENQGKERAKKQTAEERGNHN